MRRFFQSWRVLRVGVSCPGNHVPARSFATDMPIMPECEVQPEPYQGPAYERAIDLRQRYMNPSLTSNLFYKKPLLITQGHMQYLWDHTGRRYLDMFACLVTSSVGHCHPKVQQAAEKQLKKLWGTNHICLSEPVHEFAEKLASKMPGNLKVCYFTNSGSQASDLAMLLARIYTESFDIIALRNSFFGVTPYCANMIGVPGHRHHVPMGFGVQHAMNADPYRGPWGGKACRDSLTQVERHCDCPEGGECEAASRYAEQLEEVLRLTCSYKRVAAFFTESIQGLGGVVQFPRGYLKKAFKLIRDKGGLCVADEAQAGLGRTGDHYWSFESHDVIPDIVIMAKGIGNGVPLAAVVTTPEIAQALDNAIFLNEYGGSPLPSAVGKAVLDVIDEERCMERSRILGRRLYLALAALRDELPVIGDVRGKGFMLGMELVSDKERRLPLSLEKMNAVLESCREMGLLIGYFGNVLRIKPPMCITEADADFAVAVIRRALEQVSQDQ